ncbi:MAG TPA: PaaI family thioesterase [Candidatus Acidoferrales bacterium]|nr:PaaI family thioesterase [Candidatus Acidoferrales bacterium]
MTKPKSIPKRPEGSRPSTVRQIREFLARVPFNELLGIEFHRAHSDGVTIRCQLRDSLMNGAAVLHGGVTATLADVAVAVAIHHRFGGTRPITTVELKINYFRPVSEGTVYARATLLRVGGTLCVGRVDMTDDQERAIGVAIVTYIFLKGQHR